MIRRHLQQGLAHLVQRTLQLICPGAQGLHLRARSRDPSRGDLHARRCGKGRRRKARIPVPLTTTKTPASSSPAIDSTPSKAFRTETSRACSITCWHADLLAVFSPGPAGMRSPRSGGSSYWHRPIISFHEAVVNRDPAKDPQSQVSPRLEARRAGAGWASNRWFLLTEIPMRPPSPDPARFRRVSGSSRTTELRGKGSPRQPRTCAGIKRRFYRPGDSHDC